jgi:zinc protease
LAHLTTTRTATLDNGLTVLVKESHRVPVVSFWIWYRVGSRNELPGSTGISHWVEHMLFKGTPDYQPGAIFRTINKFGGTLNGFTWIDFTAYFETLPNTQLELAASIEADRMENAVFDPEEVEKERTVILSEREGAENQPGFHLNEELMGAAFRHHPYGQSVIGFESDLLAITREELYRHYRTYYTPRNATVIVVGAVDSDEAIKLVEAKFGGIASGPEMPVMRAVEPEQVAERRLSVRRPAPAPQLAVAYHAPSAAHPDSAPMAVLDTVLSGGKGLGMGSGGGMGRSSRLYRALVASGLCSGARSSFPLTIDPYLFTIGASLIPTTPPPQVEEVVFEETRRLREEPVEQPELDRAIKQIRAQFAYATESVTQQAYWLGSMRLVAPEIDPDDYIEQVASVTADDVQRVAEDYLPEGRYTLGWLEPTDSSGGDASHMDAPPLARPHFFSDGRLNSESRHAEQLYGAPRTKLEIRDRHLSNGTYLISNHDATSEAVVVELRIPAGSALDGDTPGLARLTGQMLARGTARRDFASLNEELDSLGAAVGVDAGREHVDISVQSLREDAERIVQLMAEVLTEPSFPEEELERVRAQSLSALRRAKDDTRSEASYALRTMLYPEGHPLRHRALGTEESLASMTREQLVEFHRATYTPEGAIFAAAGGVEGERVAELIEHYFAGWQRVDSPLRTTIPPVDPPVEQRRHTGSILGKSQSDLAIGLPVIPRQHPDYDALRMANLILGRLGLMGRLGANVRDRQGLAYYVFSNMTAGRDYGRWTAQAGVNPANVDRAVEAVLEELGRLREDFVEPDELYDAKSFVISSLPVGLETSGAIVGTLLSIAFHDLGLDFLERLPERTEAITAEDVRAAARSYLDPERMAIAVVGP